MRPVVGKKLFSSFYTYFTQTTSLWPNVFCTEQCVLALNSYHARILLSVLSHTRNPGLGACGAGPNSRPAVGCALLGLFRSPVA